MIRSVLMETLALATQLNPLQSITVISLRNRLSSHALFNRSKQTANLQAWQGPWRPVLSTLSTFYNHMLHSCHQLLQVASLAWYLSSRTFQPLPSQITVSVSKACSLIFLEKRDMFHFSFSRTHTHQRHSVAAESNEGMGWMQCKQ
jgi:hypothetical protein